MSNIDGFPGDFPGGTQDTNTIAGDTQGYLASPSRPRRRESSFFVSHPRTQQPPTGPDSGHQEPTTPDKYIFVEFTDVIVEALWDDSVYARVLFWNDEGKPRDWIELQQHEEDPTNDEKLDFTIRVGQDRPVNGQLQVKVTSEITNAANWGKQAANRPKDWHYFVTSLLTVIRNAALATELKDVRIAELTKLLDNSQQLEAGHVSSKDFNVKCKEVKKLQAAITRLQNSQQIELAADPAYKALLAERNALTVERDDFKVRHEDCVDRGSFNSLRDKYDREKKDADLYYHKYNNAANAHDRDRSQWDQQLKAKD
ncbi:hypothetical protein L13192_09475 [Pyrenophora tritici-repentis]|nr:hypothetical protein L13192_09475 [Pyrenophora tritici-repentis]